MISTIEKHHKITWEIKDFPNYVFCDDKKLYNRKTNRQIKPTYNSCCMGFWINRKFISLTKLRKKLIKPQDSDCPF